LSLIDAFEQRIAAQKGKIGLLRPAPSDLLRMWLVSRRVSVLGHGDDDLSLTEPVEDGTGASIVALVCVEAIQRPAHGLSKSAVLTLTGDRERLDQTEGGYPRRDKAQTEPAPASSGIRIP
jgi:hypothetical protein